MKAMRGNEGMEGYERKSMKTAGEISRSFDFHHADWSGTGMSNDAMVAQGVTALALC